VTLELLADPVPNVRLAATALLPALKTSIRLPEDVEQLVGGGGRRAPGGAGCRQLGLHPPKAARLSWAPLCCGACKAPAWLTPLPPTMAPAPRPLLRRRSTAR
jgi:hypothetical protein